MGGLLRKAGGGFGVGLGALALFGGAWLLGRCAFPRLLFCAFGDGLARWLAGTLARWSWLSFMPYG